MGRCDQCQFFYPHEPAERPGQIQFTAEEIYGGGQCRRHPPVPDKIDFRTAKFPVVASDYWCGEFVARCAADDRLGVVDA